MESEGKFSVCLCLAMGICLIFLPSFGVCLHDPSSLSIQVGGNNLKKYIMESYDVSHHNCDFLARDLGLNQCEEALPGNLSLKPKLSSLKRDLIGEGSHRLLSTSISLKILSQSISNLPTHLYKIIIVETLPSGVFSDPFELQHLLHRNVFSDVAVFGDTNLELPTLLSNRSIVEIHKDIGTDLLLRSENGFDINIELPLHVRYPPLDESGYLHIRFGGPHIFLQCEMEVKLHKKNCLYSLENEEDEVESGEVLWKVATGKKAHAGFVHIVTFISALLSAFSIVFTSLSFTHKATRNLKQS